MIILIIINYNIDTVDIMYLKKLAKSIVVSKPIQNYDQSNAAVKQNVTYEGLQNYNTEIPGYMPQKVENKQYHSRIEESSTKIPACLNRQSSTLIYSSESSDLGMFLIIKNLKVMIYYLGCSRKLTNYKIVITY